MIKPHRVVLSLAIALLLWVASPALSYAATSGNPPTATISDNFSSGTLAPFVANNDMSPGGHWSVANDTLVATDYGLSHNLINQIASIPHTGRNVVLSTSFTINQLNVHQSYRIGVFGRGSAPKTGSSQWDIVLSNGNLDLINQFLGVPAKVPFPVQAGQSYDMVAVVDGTWVGAQVWPQGSPEPSQWTVSGTFTNTGEFTGVGVAAGNADVTFQDFAVYSAPPQLSLTSTQPSAIYQSGQPLTYTATVSANTSSQEEQSYAVDYALTTLGGATAAQGTIPLTIPSNGSTRFAISLPAQPNGYYHVTFSLTSTTTGLPLTAASPFESNTTSLAVVPNAASQSTLNSGSPFGINGPGNQYGPITPSLEQRWIHVDQLFKNQGIQWVRTQFLWNNVEPSPGVYTWNTSDGLVMASHSAAENILGLVDYAGNYANPFSGKGEHPVSFSTFVQDYDQYVQALVERYMPGGTLAQTMGWHNYGISTWEIWNEPSQKQYWPSQNPTQYAELVQSASAAIKAVDPTATVLAYDWQTPTLIQTAGPTSFTGLSIHEYPAYPSESAFYDTIANLRQLLVQNGLGNDPIWMTETGWSTAHVTATQQAEYLQRAAIESLAASLNKFFMFDWSYPSSGYGELTKSLLPLPSYPALAAVADELNGYTPVAGMNPVSMGSAIRAFVFQNGSSSLVAVWSPKSQGSLTLNSAGVNAVDWMGNSINPTNSQLTVPLSGEPVFLKADLSPQELVTLIQGGIVTGIPAVSLDIQSVPQPASLPPIHVTVTNQVSMTESGTLTLTLPSGWEAVPASNSSSSTPSPTPSVTFGPLNPGASLQETFNLVQFDASPSNQYPVTASATVSPSTTSISSDDMPPATTTLDIRPAETVYGTPRLTGSFSDWNTALPLHVDQKNQNVGIPHWSSSLASATGYTMWNKQDVYFAAQVVDSAAYFEPYDRANIWKGDSVQIYIDPKNTKTNGYNGADGDTQISLAKTPNGNQVYERHPFAKLLTNVKVTIVPGPSNGDMWYEAAIPVADLPHWTAQSGRAFGLDFLVNYNFGYGRVGWMELTPGVGTGFDPAQFPTFTLVNSARLAALALNPQVTTGTMTVTPDAIGALLAVTNNGLTTITVSLSNGTTLTLNTAPNAKATVVPSGPNPVVPILLNGTTTVNLAKYVSPGSSISLTASATSQTGESGTITVEDGVNGVK